MCIEVTIRPSDDFMSSGFIDELYVDVFSAGELDVRSLVCRDIAYDYSVAVGIG